MKILNLLLVIMTMAIFSSCGSDDDCIASDWIGIYDLDSDTVDCSDPNISLSETIEITAGSTENSINFDGIEAEIDGCKVSYTDPFFGITGDAELNGDQLVTGVLGCTGTFVRR